MGCKPNAKNAIENIRIRNIRKILHYILSFLIKEGKGKKTGTKTSKSNLVCENSGISDGIFLTFIIQKIN